MINLLNILFIKLIIPPLFKVRPYTFEIFFTPLQVSVDYKILQYADECSLKSLLVAE